MASHSSILAWKNTMGRKAWPVVVLGVAKSWTQLSTHMHAMYVAGSPWPLGELIIRVTEIQRSELPNKSLIDRLPMRFSSPSRRVLFCFKFSRDHPDSIFKVYMGQNNLQGEMHFYMQQNM